MKLVIFGLLLLCSSRLCAQVPEKQKVLLIGKVVDTLQPQGFYNLMIVNRTSGRGVFGQPDGSFYVYVNENDSINLSTKGYPIYAFRVKADSNHQMRVTVILENKVQNTREVVVKPLKTLQQIKEERASLSQRETRQVTGIEVLRSPITALYQRFSQKEQNKAWIAKMEFKDNQARVLKELLRVYVAYDIVSLSEEEFEDFINFLNMDENFLKTASDIELVTFIKDKYEHYMRLKE
ncbi:MAG: hypothetical protein K0R65_357 [Crocinitomicaceae bacterium]|jgi:hypothetical protein|nr:hypothetical protein [Crocinitomicaceae bacterium]